MQNLAMLGLESEVYSVDLTGDLYINRNRTTGYVYTEMKEALPKGKSHQKFLFGKTIAGQLDEIGTGIDLAILDTTHMMPGEILDFIVMAPYLSENAVVILHDVDSYYEKVLRYEERAIEEIATRVLFSVVTAKRLVDKKNVCCNIAAFELNRDTLNNIQGCFYALSMPWGYRIPVECLAEYRRSIVAHYDRECVKLFDQAVQTNWKMYECKANFYLENEPCYRNNFFEKKDMQCKSKIVIYGAGTKGKQMYSYFSRMKWCEIVAWVDKNYEAYQEEGLNVISSQQLKDYNFDSILVAVMAEQVYSEIERYLLGNNLNQEKIIYGPVEL